jgi:hypothetical protein
VWTDNACYQMTWIGPVFFFLALIVKLTGTGGEDVLRAHLIENFFMIADRRLLEARVQHQKGDLMKSSVTNLVMALGLVAIGVAIGAAGIYIGEDDAPGAALIGILLMIGAVALGVRTARLKT